MFALESAMDELAAALKIDPLELRLRNYAETRPARGQAVRRARRCGHATRGAPRRSAGRAAPPSRARCATATLLIGWGMATATYPTNRSQAGGHACVSAPTARRAVQCGTQDIGTGTYTVMAQVAADALGLPLQRVRVRAGRQRFAARRRSRAARRRAASVGAGGAGGVPSAAKRSCSSMALADQRSPLAGASARRSRLDDGAVPLRAHGIASVAICGTAGAQRLERARRSRPTPSPATRRSAIRCTPSARNSPRCGSIPILARSASRALSALSPPGASSTPRRRAAS